MKPRIIFAGTPEFAAGHLRYLIEQDFNIVAVYSQPDRPKGRGKKLQPSPVKQIALEYDIPVYQPENFKSDESLNELKALNTDIMVVVAYGLLLPEAVLNTPKYGCINVHASLLPRWRGAAPIERALEAGDSETGVTIMQMDKGLDTGAMISKKHLAINSQTTGDSLREQLLNIGQPALAEALNAIFAGTASFEAQDDSLANYAKKLTKQEAAIDWQQSAQVLQQKIHAFDSANVCYAHFNDERVKIAACEVINEPGQKPAGCITAINKKSIDVATGEGILRLTEIQLNNAKRLPVAAVLNGKRDYFSVGQCFE